MRTTILWLLLFSAPACAQIKIQGRIVDEKGEGLPGVNVSLQNSYDGASTDVEGRFSFTTAEQGSGVLVVTYVGYTSISLPLQLANSPVTLSLVLKEEINQLDAVTISAGSFTAGDEKRRTILKAVDIATTAGATADIAGALNTLPGTTKVGESGRLFVRGGDGNETRTFIDGMVVLDAYGPAAPNTPSRGRFLPFMFKGTSFSTGGYSCEFGQALSSALILDSKDRAEVNQTDIGILSVGADVAHTHAWNRSSFTGKVQYTDIRPYFNLINQRVDWVNPPVSLQSSAAYRKQIGEDGMLKLFGNINRTNYTLYNHDIANPERKILLDLSNTYGYGNAAYRQSLSNRWSVRGGLSYNYNENSAMFDSLPAIEKEGGIHSKVVFENTLSRNVELKMGGEVLFRDYSAARQSEKNVQLQTLSFRETIGALFAEAEAYTSKHLVVKAGTRLEYNSLLNKVAVDPRLSIAYRPGRQGQFAFAYGRFRQSVANQYLRLNTSLNNENAQHFIVNYQVVTGKRTFRIETYYKTYDNLVKFDGDPLRLTNAGKGYAKGIELFWRDNQSVKNVDYWVSYSYLDTRRDYLNFPVMATPSFASAHNFSFVYKHFVPSIKSQLGFTYSFASGRPYYNPNKIEFNSDMTPAYHDLSANIAYLPKPWLILYLSCTNLLGRDNIFGYNYAAVPDAAGVYASEPIRQPAARFLFVGIFITLSKNKSINQLPNL